MSEDSALPPAVDLTIRDRYARLRAAAATPSERLAAMRVLLERSWALLQKNPQALAHFRRRNFKARSVPHDGGRPDHGT